MIFTYKRWEPIYKEIIEDLGYDEESDRDAATILSESLRNPISLDKLREAIEGEDVIVCGNAPSLHEEIRKEDIESTYIAADGATSILLYNGIIPRVIVTDLDGTIGDILYADKLGSIVVVHAHGDNIDMLRKVVPLLHNIIGTTQTKPFDDIYNFGGFTDGDRCVFIAKTFDVNSIKLIGFDYLDATEEKRKKLKWAKELIDLIY